MLLKAAVKFPQKRAQARRRPPIAAPVPLTLVSAAYADADFVELTFDRPVDASRLASGQIIVDDGVIAGSRFLANGPVTMINPTTVQIGLTPDVPSTSAAITLDATAFTGIVAVNDTGIWPGVSDYEPDA